MSGLCLVHCLALPVLSAGLPALGALAEAEWVHLAILVMAAPTAALALLRPGHGLRPSRLGLTLGGSGLGLLAIGVVGPHAYEHWANVAGGLGLASAHIFNAWRRRRLDASCTDAAKEANAN